MAVSYVRLCTKLEETDENAFFETFPQLFDCIQSDDSNPDVTGQSVVSLLKRHARDVLVVMSNQVAAHQEALAGGRLPWDCLLAMVASGKWFGEENGGEAVHELSGGRPSVPVRLWETLTGAEKLVIDLFPASSAEISRQLQAEGKHWKASTVDTARSRVRARLKTLGLGQVLPDARPSSSGRKRPQINP